MEKPVSRLREHPAVVLAAGAMLASGALLLHWLSRLTFWRDEWGFLLHRRGWSVGTFLDPAVEHLSTIPILLYKLQLEIFGMSSPASYQVVAVVGFLVSVALLFTYVRLRVGEWVALAAILPILFLGPSWDDLLFPYQIGFFGSMACGLATLLCLDRPSRRRDVAAAILLTAALLFSDAGLPFVAAAAVSVGLDSARLRRAFVAVIPAVLWLIWYLGWGHTANTFVSFHNAANLPSYVLDGISSSLASLLGLGAPVGDISPSSLDWGRPLLVLALAIAGWRTYRLGRVPSQLLVALTVLVGFWALTGLNASVFGLPTAGRYQYIGVIGVVLVAAELARGVEVRHWVAMGLVAVAAAAALSNFARLKDSAHGLEGIAQQQRGGLAAIELARGQVDPNLTLTQDNSGVDYLGLVDASSYLSAVDAFGSPAYPAGQLPSAPEAGQVAADRVSALALRIALHSAAGAPGTGCATVSPSQGPAVIAVPPGGVLLTAQTAGTHAALHRFASESFPVAVGPLPRGRRELLRIPPDRSPQPWTLQLTGGGAVRACRLGAA
jgi:hypothetical protein